MTEAKKKHERVFSTAEASAPDALRGPEAEKPEKRFADPYGTLAGHGPRIRLRNKTDTYKISVNPLPKNNPPLRAYSY